jgi:hypothetical protein
MDGIGGFWPTVFLLALAVILPMTLGWYVLGPISKAGGRLRAPTRFMLGDILWLLVHVQLILWYCVRFIGVQQRGFFVVTLAALFMAVLATWAGAVSFVSRAGVVRPSRRVTFILVHLPVTLGLMILAPFAILILYMLATGWLSDDLQFQLEYLVALIGTDTNEILGFLLVLPVIAWGLRRLAIWILSGAIQAPVASGKAAPGQPVKATA